MNVGSLLDQNIQIGVAHMSHMIWLFFSSLDDSETACDCVNPFERQKFEQYQLRMSLQKRWKRYQLDYSDELHSMFVGKKGEENVIPAGNFVSKVDNIFVGYFGPVSV